MGIRTSALIVLGTYVFIASSNHFSNAVSDPSRIIGQVITGIGVGLYRVDNIFSAIKLSVVVVAVLVGVDLLEDYSQALTRGVHMRYRNWRARGTDNGDAPPGTL